MIHVLCLLEEILRYQILVILAKPLEFTFASGTCRMTESHHLTIREQAAESIPQSLDLTLSALHHVLQFVLKVVILGNGLL
jgi:hypothetical protein